jgi:hypothetical protein
MVLILAASFQLCNAGDTLTVKNFIIKSHIILLNRKPSPPEVFALIRKYDLIETPSNKTKYIQSLFSDPSFAQGIFEIFSNDFLEGVDNDLIIKTIGEYNFLLHEESQAAFQDIFDSTLQKTIRLRDAVEQLRKNEITISQLQYRCMDNKFYDEKNMGEDNFVISTFLYLFCRNPTSYELKEGKKMVTHNTGVLFNETGFSKENYLNILYECDEYVEGQVTYWYQRILNRQPTREELINEVYVNKNKLKKIIAELLFRKDFAGF